MKSIIEFPGYFIDKQGNVYSEVKRHNQPPKLRRLSPFLQNGYSAVQLVKNNRRHKKYIHSLLLETFIGPCPPGYQCRHLDSDRKNNDISNLLWGTVKENQVDRINNGTSNRGMNHPNRKLNSDKIIKIRQLLPIKTQKEIAKEFGVAASTIGSIAQGRRWSHII